MIDIHQILLISLFPTPFGHFQFLGSAGQNPNLILTLCHNDDDDEFDEEEDKDGYDHPVYELSQPARHISSLQK